MMISNQMNINRLKMKDMIISHKIDDISVKQHQMVCLLDDSKWLNDDVISAYICCIKDQVHVQNKNDGKVYFENPFISRLLKRDGGIGIHGDGTFMTDIVRNYLKYDMIELPINIDNKHWYLAIVNAKKSEIQVFDSLCWEFNRNDLTTMLQGLQYHLDILRRQQDSISHKWTDLDVTKWMITEQLREPIQEDSSSCGLFMLKFMEYSTEDTLCHPITQEIITPFRYKLASILLCWKTNTAAMTTMLEQSDIEEDPNDVVMLESPEDQNKAKSLNSLSFKNKYQSLISVISNMSLHALVGRLCSYIKSIKCMETLEFIFQCNQMVITSCSYWTMISKLSTFWTLLLLIPSINTTHMQDMCTKFCGLLNT
ncbi:putative ubiquitin-like-specific protease 1B isoform X5 [Aegilops tauschii subsp. strangulata]